MAKSNLTRIAFWHSVGRECLIAGEVTLGQSCHAIADYYASHWLFRLVAFWEIRKLLRVVYPLVSPFVWKAIDKGIDQMCADIERVKARLKQDFPHAH